MNEVLIIVFTLLIILSLLTLWYITNYMKLFNTQIRMNEANEIILEELKNRCTLINNSKSIIKKSTKKEIKIFKELEDATNTNISSFDLDRIVTSAIDTIYKIKNDYPKLDEKKEFKNIILKIEESETKIVAAKNFYNKNDDNLIHLLKKHPRRIIAKIHNIKISPKYDVKEIFNENDDGIKI